MLSSLFIVKCKPKKHCKNARGVCKHKCNKRENEIKKGCKGKKCKCCVKKVKGCKTEEECKHHGGVCTMEDHCYHGHFVTKGCKSGCVCCTEPSKPFIVNTLTYLWSLCHIISCWYSCTFTIVCQVWEYVGLLPYIDSSIVSIIPYSHYFPSKCIAFAHDLHIQEIPYIHSASFQHPISMILSKLPQLHDTWHHLLYT